MTILDNLTPEEAAGISDDVSAAVRKHPFFRRLAETEHEDQPTTANAGADELADGTLEPASSATSAPAVGATPEPAPVATPAPAAAADEAAVVTDEAPGTYLYRDGDQAVELTPEQIRAMVALNQWAAAIPEPVARQFGAIEQGIAVAVPTDEYARFQAWVASQGSTGGRSSNVSVSTVPEWVQDLDPEAQQFLTQLQADNAALQQQAARAQEQAVASMQPTIAAQQEQVVATFDRATADYAAANGFTPEQAGELLDLAVRANIIPNLVEAQRQYSPSGMLVRDADFAVVARQALDFGRLQRPDLVAAANPNIPAPAAPASAPSSAPTVDPVVLKKARSASLAAAPSAATVPPGFDPRTATPQAQRDAIAQDLRNRGIAV